MCTTNLKEYPLILHQKHETRVKIEINITIYRAFQKQASGCNFCFSRIFSMQPPLDGKVTLLSLNTIRSMILKPNLFFGVSRPCLQQTIVANTQTKYLLL